MSDRFLDQAKALLAAATNLTVDQIPDDAAIGQFAEWDSMVHMRLILAIEERLHATLSPQRVVEIKSIHDVEKVVAELSQ